MCCNNPLHLVFNEVSVNFNMVSFRIKYQRKHNTGMHDPANKHIFRSRILRKTYNLRSMRAVRFKC